MKKSMYQAIRLFLFSLLLPLLGLIINSLKSLDWEIVYDSPFLLIVIAHALGLTKILLYSIVVNQKTLENLGVCKTIAIALIAPAIDLLILQESPRQLGSSWTCTYITFFITLECIPTIIPIIVKEFLRRRNQKHKA
ncbi:hypothetical protein CGSMWGv00703Bmash_05807 [Gardnerella pickettii 00703Bmash]|uniref:Uncharacterized protein n=1 Tax=Gardnerella piotii TaxID=2792977 RepID=A0AAU8NNT8_9BIFI|nr:MULTISPECIES: hypothetical protein [Gardnerella]MCT7841082.1 hypothetical protein [Lactobacillus crispatus]EIK82931.1 hypothetical protein CGSMWGv00703Bmash_05807 [Gardnerella pickettii 00703Bmash]EIK86210.1 hypothetical protein CGSMWGv00703C2mash_01494 [Gardnerella pickettii 00703C2mash]MDF2278252.1 hypothetical protein [Gardnerella pickettii]RDW99286.1 hypothetical protein gvb01_05015 [Gardnerella vaginalis]